MNKRFTKKSTFSRTISILAITVLLLMTVMPVFAFASAPTDEILDYEITADVNDDATVTLTYHIDWKVLDSDSLGPLSWVNIGIPNSHVEKIDALSDTISSIDTDGNYAVVYFKKDYYENETVSFDFQVVQDYMYSMNALEDGSTVYYFTPGWFDEIDVDKLVIKWNNDKVTSWDGPGECLVKDGYNTWTTSMPAGDSVSIQVSYPNEAFGFDASKDISDDGYYDDDYYDDDFNFNDFNSPFDFIYIIIGILVFFSPIIGVALFVAYAIRKTYRGASGFSSSQPVKKTITRTKIVYYATCPGCGASRVEGKDKCEYCGHTMIEKEEVLKEETVGEEDKEAFKYKKDGTYHYSSSPNTYVRVHAIPVPVHTASNHHGGGGRHGGGGSGSRGSSCAHSSCACACVSCACACACACAGGGRAGCTTKDFYRTNLKLKQLKLKNRE